MPDLNPLTLIKTSNFNFQIFLALLLLVLFFVSCAEDRSPDTERVRTEKRIKDSIHLDSIKIAEEKKIPPLIINYRVDSIITGQTRDSLLGEFTEEQQRMIFAINRIEPVRVGVGTKLVFPDTLLTDLKKYAPFPQSLALFDSIGKVVIISQRVQAFGLYEEGELIHWGPVSSGKLSTPTPNGLHYGNYKAKRKVSTVNKDWILPYYFNFMNFEGVGVHQYLLPGFPASHACVRLYMEDAKYIYDWAEQWKLDPSGERVIRNGTPFMVFGEYDYEASFPWLQLAENPDSNFLSDEEVDTLEKYVVEYFKDEKNFPKTENDSIERPEE